MIFALFVSNIVIFLIILVCLWIKIFKLSRDTMYSYKLMSLFSLTIFVSIMLFYYVMMILTDDYSIFTETDLYIYVSTLLGSFGVFADFVFPLVVFGAVVLFVAI